MQGENLAKNLLEKSGTEIEIAGCKLTARLLEAEEGEKFVEKTLADSNEKLLHLEEQVNLEKKKLEEDDLQIEIKVVESCTSLFSS